MLWFKIFLTVWFGLAIIAHIAKAGGWKPEHMSPAWCAFWAVFTTLLVVGIWAWF